jgi:prepilin peptidase CpaA
MVNVILVTVLIICVITDLNSRRIFNIVTVPAILIGFFLNSFQFGLDGFLFSGKGFFTGFGLLIIPFILGGIGAGDVKMLAAIGALKGPLFVLNSFLYGAVLGGAIALVIMIRRKEVGQFFKRFFYSIILLKATNGSMNINKDKELRVSIPYGLVIALGSVLTYIVGGLI